MLLLSKTVAAVATGVLTTGTAAVGVGALHQDAPTTATATAAATAATSPATRCAHPLKKLPATLRHDLRTARHQPAGTRGKEVRSVVEKALHGSYGTKAETWAQHRLTRRAFVRGTFPATLRHDLRAVHQLPADERPAARKAIRQKVLAGDYGKAVQQRAEKIRSHRAACKAQRHAGKTA